MRYTNIDFFSIVRDNLHLFDWGLKYSLDQVIDSTVVIEFPNCTLLVGLDDFERTVECEFDNPHANYEKHYDLVDAIKFNDIEPIYYRNTLSYPLTKEDIGQTVGEILSIIYHNLLHVINGDFSWVKKADEFAINRTKIQEVLGTVFIFNHPIYKKLENNDSTWADDLKTLNKT